MFAKTLVAAGAAFSLVSASAAFADTAKPVSAPAVAKIQDLSRAHAKLDYRTKSKAAQAGIFLAFIAGGAAGTALGVGVAQKTSQP